MLDMTKPERERELGKAAATHKPQEEK